MQTTGTTVGPFFWIKEKLIYNSCSLTEAENRAGKLDNPYSHEQLFDDHYKKGDYIFYPRGRVVFDTVNNKSIVYIDICIEKPVVIEQIIRAFNLDQFTLEHDDHYRCRRCMS